MFPKSGNYMYLLGWVSTANLAIRIIRSILLSNIFISRTKGEGQSASQDCHTSLMPGCLNYAFNSSFSINVAYKHYILPPWVKKNLRMSVKRFWLPLPTQPPITYPLSRKATPLGKIACLEAGKCWFDCICLFVHRKPILVDQRRSEQEEVLAKTYPHNQMHLEMLLTKKMVRTQLSGWNVTETVTCIVQTRYLALQLIWCL